MPHTSPEKTKPAFKTKLTSASQSARKTATAAAKTRPASKEGGKTATRTKPLNGLQKPLQPSKELAAIVGEGMLPRAEVVSSVWRYIKSNNLQNPDNRREIIADDKLRQVFGKDKVTMFEMNKHLAQHLA